MQTGFVRSYALSMLGGAVLVVGALLAVTVGMSQTDRRRIPTVSDLPFLLA